MSFDEYVHHISQKYRLAVAISVIKTKPNNVSVEEYLLQLQNKINKSEFDPNETVCSDDFNFDADDMSNGEKQQNTCTYVYSANETQLDCSMNDDDSQCSQTILNDFVFNHGIAMGKESTIGDTIRLLKEVATDIQEKPEANPNFSQSTFCDSQEANKTNNTTFCNTNNNSHTHNENNDHMDSQETEIYTSHGFTQNYTHISQTQGEYFVIADKYIRCNGGNIQDTAKYINGNDMQIHNASQMLTQNEITATDRDAIGITNTPEVSNINLTNSQSFLLTHNIIPIFDDNITINNGDKTNVRHNEGIENLDTQTFQFNIPNVREDVIDNNDTNARCNKDIKGSNITENNIKYLNNTDIDNSTPISIDSQRTGLDNNVKLTETNNIHKNNNENQEFPNTSKNNKYVTSKEIDIYNENDKMDEDESESDEQQERIPFKVLEELNRIKSYLNRKDRRNNDGYISDSGYRSDSQSRSSLKSLSQSCGAWLNQSAHCLFNYVVQKAGAEAIDKEIAQALGQLIDKLHEDENYPPFLEEILETIDAVLADVHEGGGSEHVLITKDENIQRLILLNKSKHILKHTIEKITNILEKLHVHLTQENLYELTNIVEVENICYIFHILEIFLKRYVKIKDSSESTQNSQEDLFPKRSSLTELWRKKWNPSCKEIVKNENKACVLKKCRDILNKIIVECMDGYSLVAFAALQCFNLIQN